MSRPNAGAEAKVEKQGGWQENQQTKSPHINLWYYLKEFPSTISTKIMATLSAKIRFMSILPTLLPFLPNNVNFLYFYEYIDHLHNNIELEGGGGQWYQKISARCKWKKIRGGLQKIIPLTCNSGVRAGFSRFICTSSAIPRLLLLTNEWFILMRQE